MGKTILLLIVLFAANLANGQLVSNVNLLDYGKVEVWKNDTLVIQVQNRENTVAKLLPTYNPTVQLIGPNEIAPNSTAMYQVVVYPREKGYFEFKPTFYYSNAAKPLVFTIKGQIKTFDESALYQCPRLDNIPKPIGMPTLSIKILDTFTHKIIYHAEAALYNPVHRIEFDGGYTKIVTHFGKYALNAQAEGYISKNNSFAFDNRNKEIIIKLMPIEVPLEELVDDVFPEDEEFVTLEDVMEKEEVDEVEDRNDKILEDVFKKAENPNPIVMHDGRDTSQIIPKKIDKEQKPEIGIYQKTEQHYKQSQLPPQHIIVLADVSFSMKRGGYLDVLRSSMSQVVSSLRPQDSLTIITFSTSNIVLADHIGSSQTDSLLIAIQQIKARGGTNAVIALKSAYGVAKRYADETNATQVMLFTDGKFSTPGTSYSWYEDYVQDNYAPNGYKLNIFLFSENESDYNFLNSLSSKSAGKAYYVKEDVSVTLLESLMK